MYGKEIFEDEHQGMYYAVTGIAPDRLKSEGGFAGSGTFTATLELKPIPPIFDN
jgi:hypothetical protein